MEGYTVYLILGAFAVGLVAIMLWFRSFSQNYYRKYRQDFEEESAEKMERMWLTIRPEALMMYKIVCALVLAGFFFLVLSDSKVPIQIIVSIGAAMVGFFIPDKMIKRMYNKRLETFNDQLIDGLTIMSNGLRSGLSFPQSLEILTREMDPPISIEFQHAMQDTKLGKELDDSLREMVDRVPIDDLRILVTAITIVRRSGGNLAEIFNNIAETIRERRRIQGKIDSLTSTGKLQAIVVCAIPFFIGAAMYLIDPALIRPMWQTYPGIFMLILMFVLQYIGYQVILKICTIDI